MPTAQIIAAWRDQAHAYIAARVGSTEFTASVPVSDLQGLTAPEQKALLVAALKAHRDAQIASPTPLSITGTATV